MSKAIQGAAELGGAILIGAGMLFPPTAAFFNNPIFYKAFAALALGGIAMEAGAIADALTSNRGQNITTRQPASFRQIVYGTQRVGGVMIYRSTTGSHHDQVNYVIVLAGHECWAIQSLYLDGRKVYFNPGSTFGYHVRNGFGFGGDADGSNHTGPGGQTYNFGGLVYCEARYGDQMPGDVIGALTANDPVWAADGLGNSPYVGGCTYIYLKREYNPEQFPQEPEIRVTVMGKPIFDPRTGLTEYSANWALVANDIITDPVNGLGDPSVNQAQLIAAANVCDEDVALAAGGTEKRYECHMHYDTSVEPGAQLDGMMPGAAGRLSRIGGEWYIWPAYWQGPSFNFDTSALTGAVQWTANRGLRDLCNRVTGTYTAANYPYNVAGNLYDSNGWYDHSIANTFPFGFQPTTFPQYEQDALHGYPANQYLNEDSGVSGAWDVAITYAAETVVTHAGSIWKSLVGSNLGNTPAAGSADWIAFSNALPKEVSLQTVLSIAQAQRVARIVLMRNRQQGTGTLELGLQATGMQPVDVMQFTFPYLGWGGKLLEISRCSPFRVVEGSGDGEAPSIRANYDVQETSIAVYEWSTTEELTVYDVPASTGGYLYSPAPPTSMSLTSNAGTALAQPGGVLIPRIEVQWSTPLDGRVTQIQMQVRVHGVTPWTDAGSIDVSLNFGFITAVAGVAYDVRIRSVRASGASSVWVELDNFTAGYVLSSTVAPYAYGPGSIIPEAYVTGDAALVCEPFSAYIGNRSIAMFPGGAYTITGLAQQTFYYVYWIDPTTAGGNVTPIATTDVTDFLGKPGYFLIDSATTGFAATGVGGRYYPSSYNDVGTRGTQDPSDSFDGDLSTYAVVSASASPFTSADGDYAMQGDPAVALGAASTLTLDMEVTMSGLSTPPGQVEVDVSINGVAQPPLLFTAVTGRALYTWTVPSGTSLSTVITELQVSANVPVISHPNTVSALVYECFIQS
jgi:hypothetical protein